jgi:chemotaxis protein methyltransferase CheR
MVDILTTNKTNFFRELPHFAFLRDNVLPQFKGADRPLRIWSAGCSSGEEPYSLAILIREEFGSRGNRDVRILGTDLSMRALARAREGAYDEGQMDGVPPALRSRYFSRVHKAEAGAARYQVRPEVRSLVSLAPLNLMEGWPMKGPFDVIMCRNVMIYFDRKTREQLIQRFSQLLPPGGHLLVGHSESLNGLAHDLTYVQPAVYRK